MKIRMTTILERQRARFYIYTKSKTKCETFLQTKSQTLCTKQDNFRSVFFIQEATQFTLRDF